ncbi:cobalamin-binding protein [Litorivivens sp.]|uniref:cobalamin-binding protein n=1 Tax=Litorivivens sp. TaxID=2020868 RepID=UPI0035672437
MSLWPQRIVCLTEETTEALYLMGEQHRIVGISGFTVRPPEARKEKLKVSAFTSAKESKILELKPDLVLGFSDMQADIAADLVRAGLQVHIFNQRRVAGIFEMLHTLGRLLGVERKAEKLCEGFNDNLERARRLANSLQRRPRVYFEEWPDPMISGIGWVSDLIELAGGDDCFAELAACPDAKSRIIADPLEVVRREPDIILASWCGRKVRPEQIAARDGWGDIPAVRHGQIHEIKSPIILQPGPAALSDGVAALSRVIADWNQSQG